MPRINVPCDGRDPAAVTDRRARRTDRGATLIEILVGIVLLGMVIAGTVTTLSITVQGSALDRDHANAHAWLQTAADVLYARDLVPCDPTADPATDRANIIAAYEATVQQTDNPEDWPDGNIDVVDIEFWHVDIDPVTKLTVEGWGTQCDTVDTNLQLIELEVRSAAGEIVEQVEVIIGE